MNAKLEDSGRIMVRKSATCELAWPLLSRLAGMAKLSQASEDLLTALVEIDGHGPGQTIRRSNSTARAVVIASGWAARYRLLSDGRRQIVTLLLPGDLIQIDGEANPVSALPVITLTKVRLLNAAPLRAVVGNPLPQHAGLIRALSRAGVQAHTQLIDQIVRLGRQSGLERTAHLFVELQERVEAAGLAEAESFRLPLTQECLADTLGLSIVHVNRTLQQLRREKLIEFSHGTVRILKPALLSSIADYEPRVWHDFVGDEDEGDSPYRRAFQTI